MITKYQPPQQLVMHNVWNIQVCDITHNYMGHVQTQQPVNTSVLLVWPSSNVDINTDIWNAEKGSMVYIQQQQVLQAVRYHTI